MFLWCVSVALYVLWRHNCLYEAVRPMKLWSDAHTPKNEVAGRITYHAPRPTSVFYT
jgi:hypothetical protein